jgi:CheY-like chemotaxis protein
MNSQSGDSPLSGGAAPAQHVFRVLIIDNDEADRELTLKHLGKAWPFEHELLPDFAHSGEKALEKMRAIRYTLVILDWRLLGSDGGDVLRAMRRDEIHTPVVVVSGMQRTHIAENIEAFGAAFLNKDEMNPVTLRHAIVTSLRRLGVDSALAA